MRGECEREGNGNRAPENPTEAAVTSDAEAPKWPIPCVNVISFSLKFPAVSGHPVRAAAGK